MRQTGLPGVSLGRGHSLTGLQVSSSKHQPGNASSAPPCTCFGAVKQAPVRLCTKTGGCPARREGTKTGGVLANYGGIYPRRKEDWEEGVLLVARRDDVRRYLRR